MKKDYPVGPVALPGTRVEKLLSRILGRVLCGLLLLLLNAIAGFSATVLIEAESFENHGGWKLDTQFIHIMGSPYLLAHGLGKPVADASTTITLPSAGTYRVFVRTKDWVAHWKAPGAPGKFQLLINGIPVKEIFGTRGADWFWQDGGIVEIKETKLRLALHDLTGFDGRCDAILFTDDANFAPPNESAPMASWRTSLRGLSDNPIEAGDFDLVVIGGGYAGSCAALSAARMGCRVALIQDRPVLGGNGSSEVRVWPQGNTRRGLFPRIGEIVEELVDRPKQSPGPNEDFNDAKREAILRAEKNISLFLNHYVFKVEVREARIKAVIAMDTHSGLIRRFTGKLFSDCTGHGTVGFMSGAQHTEQKEKHMGMSNMWRWKNTDSPQSFPETPWALDLRMKDFPYPGKNAGEWFWESGFDQDPIRDLEHMRDWNLRAVFGAFNAMKNRDGKDQHVNAVLEWIAHVGGTRESRQLLGDVVLTREDIVARKVFPDSCVPTTWDIDLHYPQEKYQSAYPDNPFISRAVFDRAVDKINGYPVPYRCFYSSNIVNLFMAGRCISVTHEALGTVRVMKTGGMMGEVVGKAASICSKYDRDPRDVYNSHLDELKELLKQPGPARRETVNSPIRIPQGAKVLPLPEVVSVAAGTLEGIVIDDSQAQLTGSWQSGQGLKPFIGEHYLYTNPKGAASARFNFQVVKSGLYEVRFAYQPHTNRAGNVRVTVWSTKGGDIQRINEREKPPLPGNFLSLGTFDFQSGQTNSVVVENNGADGIVNIDAVQVLPKK